METCQGCEYYDVKQVLDGEHAWQSTYCTYFNTRIVCPIGCANYKGVSECQKTESAQ